MKNKVRKSLAQKKLAQENYLKRWESIEKFGRDRISPQVDEAMKGHKDKRSRFARKKGNVRLPCLLRAFYRMEAWDALRKAKPDQPRAAAKREADRTAMARYARLQFENAVKD